MSQYFSNCPKLRISIDQDKTETVGLSLDSIQISMSPNPNYKVTGLFEKRDSDADVCAAFNELCCCKHIFILLSGDCSNLKILQSYSGLFLTLNIAFDGLSLSLSN